MHSKKIGTVFSIGLIQRFLFRLISPIVLIRHMGHMGQLFFDEADVAASFNAGKSNLGQVVGVCAKTHVLIQIMR